MQTKEDCKIELEKYPNSLFRNLMGENDLTELHAIGTICISLVSHIPGGNLEWYKEYTVQKPSIWHLQSMGKRIIYRIREEQD